MKKQTLITEVSKKIINSLTEAYANLFCVLAESDKEKFLPKISDIMSSVLDITEEDDQNKKIKLLVKLEADISHAAAYIILEDPPNVTGDPHIFAKHVGFATMHMRIAQEDICEILP